MNNDYAIEYFSETNYEQGDYTLAVKLKLIALGLSVVLSGCSSQLVSSKSNSDFKMAIRSASSIECTDTVISSNVSCIFPIEITSTADSPKNLSGNFYAEVDGKIFLADTTYGGISSISETWNPAESKSGVVPFTVPSNSNISLIFLGPENSSSVGDAFLSLTVSVTAVDGWTPRIQKNSLQSSELKNLVKRLSKSSGNVWEIVIEGDDLSNITMYTDEGVSCVALVWAKNLMIPLRDTLSFEDLESGLGIQYNGEVKDCGKIFESTPGIKKVN